MATTHSVPVAELTATLSRSNLEQEIVRWYTDRQQRAAAELVYGYRPDGKAPPPPDGNDLDSRCIRAYVEQARSRQKAEQARARKQRRGPSILGQLAKRK